MMMKFKLKYSDEAKKQFLDLENSKNKIVQYKAVSKTLGLMQIDLRHPSLLSCAVKLRTSGRRYKAQNF